MTSASLPSRRGLLKAGLATSAALLAPATASADSRDRSAEHRLRDLEQKYGARLGVYAHNTRAGKVVAYRADGRFAMCSTFKTVAAGAILRDQDRCAPLDKLVAYPAADLVENSPITSKHVDTGMTVGDLCAAAIQYSDNTAGNLLLRQIGGPAGLTDFFRSIDDPVSRLDRWESALNTAIPGDPRDTTTPQAIGRSYERLTLGRALSRTDREQLITWLEGNTTGDERLRAGLPRDWKIGDKTGSGDYGTANDIGVAWTSRGTPIVMAVLSSKSTEDAPYDDALIADAAHVLVHTLAPHE